jgi:hypothetical protein
MIQVSHPLSCGVERLSKSLTLGSSKPFFGIDATLTCHQTATSIKRWINYKV